MTDVKVLKHLLIKDTARYARDMNVSEHSGMYASDVVWKCILQIQNSIGNCSTQNMKPLSPFLFLFRFGADIAHTEGVGLTDVVLVRVVEDMYRRVRMGLYNEPAPDFNDIFSLGGGTVPWAINDTNAYACKFGIDVSTATTLCNWLIEIYKSVKATPSTFVNANLPANNMIVTDNVLLAFQSFSAMPSIHITRLLEDVYTRFRFIVLQSCSINATPSSDLDYQAQIMMFYNEQRKIADMASQCLQGA